MSDDALESLLDGFGSLKLESPDQGTPKSTRKVLAELDNNIPVSPLAKVRMVFYYLKKLFNMLTDFIGQ